MKVSYIIGSCAFALVLAGCGGGSVVAPPRTNPTTGPTQPPTTTSYIQIELLSRPAVKEAFESFANHDVTNRTEPYNDPTLQSSIVSFSENFRNAATANALASILYPNEMVADLSQNQTTGSYLGTETGGATSATKSTFGGRELNDDVIDISLGALFGNTLSALGVVPDDGKEVPCLTTDNVSYDKSNTATFPYIGSPL